MLTRTLHLADAAATEALGARLADACADEPILVLHLRGELGAGKTCVARGLIRALGHRGPVRSPTYTLMEPYDLGRLRVLHLDLYRLSDPEEMDYLGLRESMVAPVLVLVEWPEQAADSLPAADLHISLTYMAEGRRAELSATSSAGERLLQRFDGSLSAPDFDS